MTSAREPGGSAGAPDRANLLEAAGRARPVIMAGERVLPVVTPLAPLFPEGGLRRGSVVVVKSRAGTAGAEARRAGGTRGAGTAARGVTSLSLAVAVAASQAGSWCAALGWPALGMVAAAGMGVVLERLALVPYPGEQWPAVTAALIDAVDVILIRPPRGVRSSDARRLTARVRERGVVLVVNAESRGRGVAWPEAADLSLSVAPVQWRGLGQGHGYLQARSVEVTSTGRGAATRERRVQLWLPSGSGTVGAPGKGSVDVDQEAPVSASVAG